MMIVILTALGVGGATVAGSVIGFLFREISQRFRDISLAFSAGLMLAAALLGLIMPAMGYGSLSAVVIGFFAGAICLNLLEGMTPHLHFLIGVKTDDGEYTRKVLLFVTAIAVHNLPEGIAAGVSFGSGNITDAFLISGSIALQNLPEGMVIVAPMLAVGISPKKTFLCALGSGFVEVIGTFVGFFAVTIASALLPFALAFAGGTMLYVICDEMIPQTHAHGSTRGATYAFLIGFCIMLVLDALLG